MLNLIAGFYDHGTRVMTSAEQMSESARFAGARARSEGPEARTS
jgi:hypothetical protein